MAAGARSGLAGLFFAAGLACAAADPALLPHRADYDVTLDRSSGAAGLPLSASGRLSFDFSGSPCEGYVASYSAVIEMRPNDGPARVIVARSTIFEDGDGTTLSVKARIDVDGVSQEESDGDAVRSADGALSVTLRRPQPRTLDFGRDVLFPVQHTQRVLAAARQGRTTYETPLYDPAYAADRVFDTLTVIGAPTTDDSPTAARHEALRGVRRWPVRVAYFERGRRDGAPVASFAFDSYDNGVVRALKLDYGDLVLNGEMTDFEPLPARPCGK